MRSHRSVPVICATLAARLLMVFADASAARSAELKIFGLQFAPR
jgi:hypothetical protein